MPTATSRPVTPARPQRPSRTRALARLDLTGFDPSGEALVADVLAPVADGWSAEPPRGDEHATLAELSSRAAIQIAALRTALDEAARLDRAAGSRAVELAQRLEQGARFEREMDRRLEAAGRAGQVLDQAAGALVGLEQVIAQLQSARTGAEEALRRQLDGLHARFEQRLADVEARAAARLEQHTRAMEATLAQHIEAIAARLNDVSDQASRSLEAARAASDTAESEARRLAVHLEQGVRTEADRLDALLQRNVAAAQARVQVLLDGAAQRLEELERTATRVGATSTERLEKACDRAAAVLGYDPRCHWADESVTRPAQNSLADLTQRAETAAHDADQAVIRLGVATDRAGEAEARMTQAIERIGELKSAETLLAQTAEAEQRLTALCDDLESTATSVRFNLSQAQEAELILGKTIDRARDKVQGLDRAMDQVTEQAQSMVSVARDVAGLVMKAEQARTALSQTLALAEADRDSAVPPPAGRVIADSGDNAAAA